MDILRLYSKLDHLHYQLINLVSLFHQDHHPMTRILHPSTTALFHYHRRHCAHKHDISPIYCIPESNTKGKIKSAIKSMCCTIVFQLEYTSVVTVHTTSYFKKVICIFLILITYVLANSLYF